MVGPDLNQPQPAQDQQPVIQTAPQEPIYSPQKPKAQPPRDINNPVGLETRPNDAPENYSNGGMSQGVQPDNYDRFKAKLGLSSMEGAWGIPGNEAGWVQRKLEEVFQPPQPKISASQANVMYPGMPEPFSQDIDPGVAKLQWQHYQAQKKLQDWATKGSGGPSWMGPVAGIVEGFADPINIAAGMITGGVTGALGIGAGLKGAAGVAKVFSENFAINAALETGGYFAEKSQHLAPEVPTVGGIAEGAVGGTLFHYGLQGLFSMFRKGNEALRRAPPDARDDGMRTAVAQHESGSRIDPSLSTALTAARLSGDTSSEYSVKAGMQPRILSAQYFVNRASTEGSVVYAVKDSKGRMIPVTSPALGGGVSMTADGNVANNLAVHHGGEHGLTAAYHVPPETNLLDLTQTTDKPQAKEFISKLEEWAGVKVDHTVNDELEDVLNKIYKKVSDGQLPPEMPQIQQEVAKKLGYEGYLTSTFKGLSAPGEQARLGAPPDAIHLFDANAQPKETYQANPDYAPKASREDIQQHLLESTAPDTKTYYTEEAAQQIHESRTKESVNSTDEYMDPVVKEQYDQAMKQLEEMAKENPELAQEIEDSGIKKDLERLKHEAHIDNQEKSLVQDFADCLTESVS